jgi:hypothetical protein
MTLYIFPSMMDAESWFFWLWPGAVLLVVIGVAGPASTPLAVQVLVLVISLGTNVVLYAILGWFAARVFHRST